ncbi:hypothetical protein OOU_Y34scaffold00247g71 [Pyricularia oryzae Y34]|uniref:Uncharacterized protein n=2 Tax=Pyricularia oryzae TaxID=318829 RepID=A0AA97P592_PYRO3|nr:hypothetical protein OOU_Y34scaffold00247g71 [Pyricularia oryzae Y34]
MCWWGGDGGVPGSAELAAQFWIALDSSGLG